LNVKKKIGLKEIAQEVGVSTTLVSYVLNGQKKDRISKEVADKIRQTAKDLNYQPNQIARSLKTQKTHTIGLIVADIANPFSSQLARILEDEAQKSGYTVIFGSSDENLEKSGKLIDTLLNRQVDGFIIAAVGQSEPQIAYLHEKNVPLVLIDRYFPEKAFSYVAIDNYKAAFDGVTHLVQNGCKNIGFINCNESLFHLQERFRGYEAAIQQPKHIVFNASVTDIRSDVEQAIASMLQRETPIDGLFFASNLLAIHGIRYLKNQNIRVPEQLAIVAFDETDIYDFFYSPISYIKQPLNELAKEAMKVLLAQIEGNPDIAHIHLPAELVIQQSSVRRDV
jgi:LacI family transcriptional regulator